MWQRCKWAFQTHKNELVSLQPNLSPYVCIVMMTKRSYLIKLWRRLVHTETHDANGATGDNKRPLCAVHGAYRCERRLLINGNDDDLAMTFFFFIALLITLVACLRLLWVGLVSRDSGVGTIAQRNSTNVQNESGTFVSAPFGMPRRKCRPPICFFFYSLLDGWTLHERNSSSSSALHICLASTLHLRHK